MGGHLSRTAARGMGDMQIDYLASLLAALTNTFNAVNPLEVTLAANLLPKKGADVRRVF